VPEGVQLIAALVVLIDELETAVGGDSPVVKEIGSAELVPFAFTADTTIL